MFERFFVPLVMVVFSSLYNHTYASSELPHAPNTKWVTVAAIKDSLKDKKPMNVGFDVDDTVLFSSPAYYHSLAKFCPHAALTNEKQEIAQCFKTHKFWDYTNRHDDYDIPKDVARNLIAMHLERGDNIYFISMRMKSTHNNETLTRVIKRDFALKKINPVIFLGNTEDFYKKSPKSAAIKNLNIKIYYGDKDADIESAQSVNVRAIRVMRAANSLEQPLPINGGLGEEVIIDSDL